MQRTMILGAVALLAACETDLRMQGALEPMPGDGVYRWRTYADNAFRLNDPGAEASRLRQLGLVMRENPPCAGGYQVVNRQATQRIATAVGEGIHDVYYTVRC